jgi:hypothetical protein
MATGKKTGGRKQGTPNKIASSVREQILFALEAVGGADYMIEQARANPTAFLALVGRLLPKDIKAVVSEVPKIGVIQLVPLECE